MIVMLTNENKNFKKTYELYLESVIKKEENLDKEINENM